jgi:ABC-type polysaccharide/polyol phosphate transport system ATPase subunit
VVWIENGSVIASGEVEGVLTEYNGSTRSEPG